MWFTLCGFIQKGISFITVPIFTRLLSTEQYGVVSVFNSWESLLSVLCTLNLFYGGFNNGMLDYRDQRDAYTSAIQGLITTITVVWAVLYLLFHTFVERIIGLSSIYMFAMFLQILTTASLSLWSSRERYEFRYKGPVFITLLNALLVSVIPIVVILITGRQYGACAKILTQAFITVILCGGVYFYLIYKGKRLFCREIWKTAFLFNFPLLPHYLSTMVLNQADRIMIDRMVGPSEAGIYSVAYSAAMVLSILISAINNSYAPWIYRKLERREYAGVAKMTNMMFAGIGLVLVMLISFAPECIALLAGEKYSEAIKIIPPVASSLYFIFMYQIFANVEFFFKKNKFIAYASMSGAILNIILNYVGIHQFGYIAAGYTTLICYVLFGTAHYCFMRRICKQEISGVCLFEARTIFLFGAALIIAALGIALLYDYWLVRYVVFTVVVVALWANRIKIKNIINEIKER